MAPRRRTLMLPAIGLLGASGAQALRLAAYADDRTPVAGQAKVRVIHLSPDAPAVDVVVLNGAAIAARPVQNLAFPNATVSPLVLAPGSYTLGVTATGSSTVVASQAFTLAAAIVQQEATHGHPVHWRIPLHTAKAPYHTNPVGMVLLHL